MIKRKFLSRKRDRKLKYNSTVDESYINRNESMHNNIGSYY